MAGQEGGASTNARVCFNASCAPAISDATSAISAFMRCRSAASSFLMIRSISDTRSAISGSYGARSVQRQCDDERGQQGVDADQDSGFDPQHRRPFPNNPCDNGKKGAGTGAWGLTHACSQVWPLSTNPRGGWLTALTMIACQAGIKTRNLPRARRQGDAAGPDHPAAPVRRGRVRPSGW